MSTNLLASFSAERTIAPKISCQYLDENYGHYVAGLFVITTYRIMFYERTPATISDKSSSRFSWSIPLNTIHTLETRRINLNGKLISMTICAKHMRTVKLLFEDTQKSVTIPEILQENINPSVRKAPLFAYLFGHQCLNEKKLIYNGWDVYDPFEEYHRQNIENNGWRISTVNKDYSLCDTYPALLAVPAEASDNLLIFSAPHRSRFRIPVLSWLHPESMASLTRCSQPMAGIQNRRNPHDEELVAKIRTANANSVDLHIFDARPQRYALANRSKGGGIENPKYYTNIHYFFMNLSNLHSVRASQTKLMEACYYSNYSNWYKLLQDSKWLYNLQRIIDAAVKVAEGIENKTSIMVHCSDGWDRTAQITSLAMLMLDPHYRTLRGFQVLIEKEWVSFGHKFCQRTGGPADGGNLIRQCDGSQDVSNEIVIVRSRPEERSPVFLQFIDCVWQISQQFPTALEFNEHFLITVMDELYAARFGTFLFDNERDSRNNTAQEKTVSLWAYINENKSAYINPIYTAAEISGHRVILPDHSLTRLTLWKAYFLRWKACMGCQEPVNLHTPFVSESVNQFRILQNKLSLLRRKSSAFDKPIKTHTYHGGLVAFPSYNP